MKNLMILGLAVLFLGCKNVRQNDTMYEEDVIRLFKKADKESYNKDYVIVIDYSIHSGLKRGFLIDKDNNLQKSFLVAHGSGSGTEGGRPKTFSNVEGSNSSSLGVAVLDGRDYSQWGINIKYWLKGLEDTNDNLKSRIVVLHSWYEIPDENVYPSTIVNSQGCPTISDKTMTELDSLIRLQSNKKILILFKKNGLKR